MPTNQTGTNYPQPHGTGSYLFTSDYGDEIDPGAYYDAPNGPPLKYWPFGYEDVRNGMAFEELVYVPNADGSQGPLIQRKLIQWEMSSRVIPQRLNFQGEIVVTAFRNAAVSRGFDIQVTQTLYLKPSPTSRDTLLFMGNKHRVTSSGGISSVIGQSKPWPKR